MRQLQRSVARAMMKASGYTRINKKKDGGSFFSNYWREVLKRRK